MMQLLTDSLMRMLFGLIIVGVFLSLSVFASPVEWGLDNKWKIEVVDNTSLFLPPSSSLDSNDNPHIIYCEGGVSSTHAVKYAYNDTGGWHISEIDDSGAGGTFSSIAIDTLNRPHVSYIINEGDTSIERKLIYAMKNPSGWEKTTVATGYDIDEYNYVIVGKSNCIALTKNDNPGILVERNYLPISYGNDHSEYWLKTPSGWVAAEFPAVWARAIMNDHSLVYDSNNRGQWCESIGYGYYTNKLRRIFLTLDSEFELDCIDFPYTTDDYRVHDFVLDSLDYPHLCCNNQVTPGLLYVWKNSTGWHIEHVLSGDIGFSSLALDSQEYPHISYYNYGEKTLEYVWKDVTGWHRKIIEDIEYGFTQSQIHIGNDGKARIIYCESGDYYADEPKDAIKYAYQESPSPPKPVLLVHGWHGNPGVWVDTMIKLDEEEIPYWLFDYEAHNDQDPRQIAQFLKTFIETKRAETGYTGDIDIVCHSMGAMVSRYYIEHVNPNEPVNQWIGIAPVNHGAALADLRDKPALPWIVKLLKLIWPNDPLPDPDEPAIIQMNTTSDTTTALQNSLRSDIKYRVIAGFNPTHAKGFSFFFGLTREKWNGNYYTTYNGDGTVAIEQSILAGHDYDVYPLYGDLKGYNPKSYEHTNLPQNPLVVDKVIEYLKNPGMASSQYRPASEHLPDQTYDIEETGNQGYITHNGELTNTNFPVDDETTVYIGNNWPGSTLQLIVESPSGQIMQPDTYPVISYSNGSTFEQYGIETTETGIWNISVVGIDVPEGGESYNLTFSKISVIPKSITNIGVFRPTTHTFYLDSNGNGRWDGGVTDRAFNFGLNGDTPISGDWNSLGKTSIGVFRPTTHTFYLDWNGNGRWDGGVTDRAISFGLNGDTPVSGDWNTLGKTCIGVFRPTTHTFYLDWNGNGRWDGGVTDRAINFGLNGDTPISGDWNGIGRTCIAVFRPTTHTFYLDWNGNGRWDGGVTDRAFNFGLNGDIPVSGDWNGIGRTCIGVYRPSTRMFYLDWNGNGRWDGGVTDRVYNFGLNGDQPLSGMWN